MDSLQSRYVNVSRIIGMTVGALIVGGPTGAPVSLPDVAVGQVLVSGGVGVAPSYSASPSLSNVTLAADLKYTNSGAISHFFQGVGTPAAGINGDSWYWYGGAGGPATALAIGALGGQVEIHGGTGGAGSAAQVSGDGGAGRLFGGDSGASGGAGRGNGGGVRIDSGEGGVGAHISIAPFNASNVEIGRSGIITSVAGRLTTANTSGWDFHNTGAATCGGQCDGLLSWTAGAGLSETVTGTATRTASSGHCFNVGASNPFYLLTNEVYIQPGATLKLQNTASLLAAGNFASDFSPSTGVFKTSTGINTLGGIVNHTKNQNEKQGADVASANNLALGTDGNYFAITGTTQINLISATNWQDGSLVTLHCTGSLTIKNDQATSGANTKILLAGGTDIATATANVVSLRLGTIGGVRAWRQIGAAVLVA